MKKRIILIIIAIIIAVFVIKMLIPTEKGRVKKDLKSLENAFEKENRTELLKYIDETYTDRNNMTYEQLVTTIDNFFGQVESIKVSMSRIKINIDSTNSQKTIFASCSLGLKIFARFEGNLTLVFGGAIKPAPVRAYFKKSNKHYRVYYAEY